MVLVDFTQWRVPDLELKLGGETYMVPPPDVERAGAMLALVAAAEIRAGVIPASIPDELVDTINRHGQVPLGHITLTKEVWERMKSDKVPALVIDRMAYYALFFWTRGKERADAITERWVDDDDARAEESEPGEASSR